ncbi:MAG: uroporphyrinogen-III C-methyltransferase [Chloroflexota bacterium]
METTGKVTLVGSGPGDPGLITVKGLRALQRAEVVLYDRLIAPELLAEAPLSAEVIPVGKIPGEHCLPQAEINTLLIAKAQQGKRVVRLKGGDPFVFGQGGEECEALAAAGIPFEVVPGVTSAIAVPAYAGIPVTHRRHASLFTVVTGRTQNGGYVDWEALPTQGTLIFLMGAARLAEIADRLQTHGWEASTPAAVIHRGTTCHQQVVRAALAEIATAAAHLEAPSVIVVGEVVRLQERISWFDPGASETTRVEFTQLLAAIS